MGKHKKKVFCSICHLAGKTSRDHCRICNKHHKKSDPCIKGMSENLLEKEKKRPSLDSGSKSIKKKSCIEIHDFFPPTKFSKTTKYRLMNTRKVAKVKFYFCYRIGKLIPLPDPSQNCTVWFSNFGNINNMHLIDPPGDGDCFFHIISYIAKLNR